MSADRTPRENPITSQPATQENCAADRAAAQGQGAATTQSGDARAHGNEAGGNR